MLFLTAAVFTAAGFVKGVAGMGLPTVAMSLLGLAMSPTSAAALLVAPSIATNIAQCAGPHAKALAWRLWPAWMALAAATVLVPLPAARYDALDVPHIALGLVLAGYGLWGLSGAQPPRPPSRPNLVAIVAGGITGVISAATAVFVMPLVPYLQALRLERDALIQALGLSFMVATLALAVRLQSNADLDLTSPQSGLSLVGALVGLWIGTRVRSRLGGPAFQRALQLTFVVLGAANLWKGLGP